MAFVLTLLSGKEALWGTVVWGNQDPCCTSFQALSEEMRKVFDHAAAGREVARLLADLCQGECSVSEYSIQFRTLATECHWNEEAQWDRFLHGLADRIQREIYMLDLPPKLNEFIELALRVDVHESVSTENPIVQHRELAHGQRNTVCPMSDPEHMQVGRGRLSREERERWRSQGLCLYFGKADHFIQSCPVKE